MLVEQGHTVTWWSVDFHHRTKSRRSLDQRAGGRGQRSGGRSQEPREGTPTGKPRTGQLELRLLPVPEYRKNISFARLRSHLAYGREFAGAAAERIARDPEAVPEVIHLSAPPLDCIAPALELKQRYGCRVTVDVMDLWPETFYRTLPRGLSILGKLLFSRLHRQARRAYREADGVTAVSQEYLNLVAEVRGKRAAERGHRSEDKTTHRSRRIVEKTEQFNQADLHLCYVGGELIDSAPRAPHPMLQPLST
jgi:hypothetical protein